VGEAASAGGVTWEEWAAKIGRTVPSLYNVRLTHPDFPAPVGRRPRPGGAPGTAFDVFDEAALDGWLAAHPRMLPPVVTFDGDVGEELTLSAIAARSRHADTGRRVDRKTVYQYKVHPDFPEPVGGGNLFRAGEVLAFLNSRPGSGNWGRGEGRRRKSPPGAADPAPAGPGAP
jgi:hypothetical protein